MKNIIITGNSKGIGKAIETEWNKYNNKSIGISKSKCIGISRSNGTNINNYKSVKKIISDSFLTDDKPIALINNAGIIKMGTILETSIEDFKNQFDVNVTGLFYSSKIYAEMCIKYGIKGKIINIASTAGLGSRAGRSVYSSTKAAVINYSLSIAEELRNYKIKVYCICPAAVDTNMRHYINPDDNFIDMLKPYQVAKTICDLIIYDNCFDNQIIKIKK
jgi:3-oxoacyl-[acyl-carrier protein] reductase